MSLLTEMETIVGDVRYVYDFFELPLLIQRRVEQFDERLDDHGEVFFFVVSTTVDLRKITKIGIKKLKNHFSAMTMLYYL